jgi:hypothetical protein
MSHLREVQSITIGARPWGLSGAPNIRGLVAGLKRTPDVFPNAFRSRANRRLNNTDIRLLNFTVQSSLLELP